MDTVKSSRDSHKTLLTMIFTEEKLFLAFLLNRCTKGAVRAVFDRLEKRMGTYVFTSIFENILTDRGSEFGDPEKPETEEAAFIIVIQCGADRRESSSRHIPCFARYCQKEHPLNF